MKWWLWCCFIACFSTMSLSFSSLILGKRIHVSSLLPNSFWLIFWENNKNNTLKICNHKNNIPYEKLIFLLFKKNLTHYFKSNASNLMSFKLNCCYLDQFSVERCPIRYIQYYWGVIFIVLSFRVMIFCNFVIEKGRSLFS